MVVKKKTAIKKTSVASKGNYSVRNAERAAVRKAIYVDARKKMKMELPEFAALMSLGLSRNSATIVKKEKPEGERLSLAVNQPEALALQFAEILYELGYDVAKTEFDPMGRLVNLPRRDLQRQVTRS